MEFFLHRDAISHFFDDCHVFGVHENLSCWYSGRVGVTTGRGPKWNFFVAEELKLGVGLNIIPGTRDALGLISSRCNRRWKRKRTEWRCTRLGTPT